MNRNSICCLTLALLLAGCSKDELADGSGLTPIRLNVGVSEEAATRAGTAIQNTQFASGETFYVYFPSNVRIGNATSASSTTFKTSNASGATTPATQPYFNAGATSATVHAYYPSTVTNTTSSFSVQQAQNTDDNYKKSDLMYATIASLSKSGASVTGNLTFNHKMAKILVTAKIGAGVTNIQSIRIIGGKRTIKISTPQSCTLSTSASDLSDANSTDSYITMHSGTSTSQVDCAALIPPQSISGNLLQIVTDKGTATYSLASAKPFASGSSYQLTITVNAAAIGTNVSISGWDGTKDAIVNPTEELIDISGATVTLASTSMTYTGSYLKPDVNSVVCNGTTLTVNTDYTISYANNLNVAAKTASTAPTVYIIGKGKYKGIATSTFAITKAWPTITLNATAATINLGESYTIQASCPSYCGLVYNSDSYRVAVNSSGNVRSVYDGGTATVTVSIPSTDNWYSSSKTFTLTITTPSTLTLTNVTLLHIGWVITSTGKIYKENSDVPSTETKAAMVAYVNGRTRYAVALKSTSATVNTSYSSGGSGITSAINNFTPRVTGYTWQAVGDGSYAVYEKMWSSTSDGGCGSWDALNTYLAKFGEGFGSGDYYTYWSYNTKLGRSITNYFSNGGSQQSVSEYKGTKNIRPYISF